MWSEFWHCNYERYAGFCDFTMRDTRNVVVKNGDPVVKKSAREIVHFVITPNPHSVLEASIHVPSSTIQLFCFTIFHWFSEDEGLWNLYNERF